MIFGRPGSGKSTFALALHEATGLPLHHLDKHFYESNWVERDYQEFMKIQNSIIDTTEWIIDGNNTKSLESRYSQADLVLYFNYPRWLCYLRTIKRLFSKRSGIDDRALGCSETIRFSLLRYMWTFEDRVKDQIRYMRTKYPHVLFAEIKNNKQTKNIMKMIITNSLKLNPIEPDYAGLPKIIALSMGNPTGDIIQKILNTYNTATHHLIGAFVEHNLIGMIGITIQDEKIIINHLAILDEYRTNGFGKRLICYIVDNFPPHRITAETDQEAVGFYRALGFGCTAFDGPYGQRYKCELEKP